MTAGLSCRVYRGAHGMARYPDPERLREALAAAARSG
jgi:hypothetical protein